MTLHCRTLLTIGLLAVAPVIDLRAERFFVSKWLQTFHETRNVDDFEKALAVWKLRETFDNPDARQPVIGFLSHLFAKHPQAIAQALGEDPSQLTAGQKATFGAALLRAGTESAIAGLKRLGLEDWAGKQPPTPIPELKISQPAEMDLCWGLYFASGDPAALGPVVEVLDFARFADAAAQFQAQLAPALEAEAQAGEAARKQDETEVDKQLDIAKKARAAAVAGKFHEDAVKFAMFEQAKWSLANQARKTPKLRTYLLALARSPRTSKAVAKELLLLDRS